MVTRVPVGSRTSASIAPTSPLPLPAGEPGSTFQHVASTEPQQISALPDTSMRSSSEHELHAQQVGLPAATSPSQAQDVGDLGLGHLDIGQAGQAAGAASPAERSTNPFRRPRSGSITPQAHDTSAAIFDDDFELQPDDFDSSYLEVDSPPAAQTPPLSTIPPTAAESTSQPQASDGSPSVLAKGKAPVVPDKLSSQPERHEDTSKPRIEAPRVSADGQSNTVYQIKHIRWEDARSKINPCYSPILTQNANGPCPLLALVNALSLSTPPELVTPFLDTLRTREQISLGLLLDAVFEELMSDRRSGKRPDLPDVGELYSFLVTLHTGMNVNPRFVPPPSNKDHAANTDYASGTFEHTREMRLYSAFEIPLIHGWIPHKHELAYIAFERIAQSYEDAQNVQFEEDDLEQKQTAGDINPDELNKLNDLKTIGQFFAYWPTQLTAHGLDVMNRTVAPGQICILFRNDHFSMLYKEPRSSRLMTLVTDAGYATHDEIVWESLVDITGTKGEWFSGDFRSVSHEEPVGADAFDQEGWTTVEKGKGRGQAEQMQASSTRTSTIATGDFSDQIPQELLQPPSASAGKQREQSSSEQEDLDLALALQLQEEEEEEQQRNETARRRAHENKMSRDFIEQQSSSERNGVQIPVRRSGMPVSRPADPADGDAPPSYLEASTSQPYHPPFGHPSNESSSQTRSGVRAQPSEVVANTEAGSSVRPGMSARQSLTDSMMRRDSMPGQGQAHASRRERMPRRREARIETGMNSANGKDGEKCNVM